MMKRIFSTMAILAILAVAFFYASGTAQAESTSLSSYAGVTAYTNIGTVDLELVKPAFLMIEYQTDNLVVGTLDLPGYSESFYDPLVLVTDVGDIVAFYPNTDTAGKIVDVLSKNLDETLLEKAVKQVAEAVEVEPGDISHYDFRNPDAEKLLLVAEYEPSGNAFTLKLDYGDDVNIINYYEKSYAFYRTFVPSFTIDQVNFIIEEQADYFGTGYYGTIYDAFPVFSVPELPEDPPVEILFEPGVEYTFAVEAGDQLGFGALAILYSGEANNEITSADIVREIELAEDPPVINQTFDLTPGVFGKMIPSDLHVDVGLEPTLEWEESTAPNYEYCIDTDGGPECDTEWISTGSDTSVTLSNLLYETDYFWQVRAFNSSDWVQADDGYWFLFVTEHGIAPETFAKTVTTLSEPTGSLSRVILEWEPSYGAYHYEVCVDTTPDCTAPEIWHDVGLATTATIGDLLLDTPYYWQVRAWNGFDEDGETDANYYTYADAGVWQSFATRTFSKLRPVDDEVYNTTLPFKWEETPLADNKYEYCIDQNDNDLCDDDWTSVTGTSMVLGKKVKLSEGKYYWQVRFNDGTPEDPVWKYANPFDEFGNPLPTGDWWSFTVLSKKNEMKINVFKVSPVDGSVDQFTTGLTLSWDTTSKTPLSYQYCFFAVDDNDFTPISDDDTCTYDDENWVDVVSVTEKTISVEVYVSTTYYWQVRSNLGNDLEPDWLYADNGNYWTFTILP